MTPTPTSQPKSQCDPTIRPQMILAMSRDNAIGDRGNLLCHIPADLRRFKALTLGHAIIMGRKTFESLPKGALPGRRNIVVTRNQQWQAPGVETVDSLAGAIQLAATTDPAPYIIGGGEIYRQSLPLVDTIELTLLDADFPDADTRLPELNISDWHIATSQNSTATDDTPSPIPYSFLTLHRP